MLKKILWLLLCIPLNGWAGPLDNNDTTDLLLGGMGVLLGHELGHLVFSQTKDIEFDGVAIVYSQSVLTPQEKLRVASAGFQVQWFLSELAFDQLQKPSTGRSRDLAAGAILGHLAITVAYLTFLKDDAYGDVTAMAEATGHSRDEIVKFLAVPAILDGWRLLGDPPHWVPHVSRGAKGWGIAWAWNW